MGFDFKSRILGAVKFFVVLYQVYKWPLEVYVTLHYGYEQPAEIYATLHFTYTTVAGT